MAKGIITSIYTDTNGTQQVILQSITDTHNHWRYTIISLLLFSMLICCAVSSIIAISRYRRDCRRLDGIKRYYEQSFKSSTPLRLRR